MTRDTRASILAAGHWGNSEDIESEENSWTTFPRVYGVLVKPEGGQADK